MCTGKRTVRAWRRGAGHVRGLRLKPIRRHVDVRTEPPNAAYHGARSPTPRRCKQSEVKRRCSRWRWSSPRPRAMPTLRQPVATRTLPATNRDPPWCNTLTSTRMCEILSPRYRATMGERLVIAMVTTANGTPTLRILYRTTCIQQFLIPPVPTRGVAVSTTDECLSSYGIWKYGKYSLKSDAVRSIGTGFGMGLKNGKSSNNVTDVASGISFHW